MKCHQFITVLFIALSFFKSNAQNFELGKVSILELQEKAHPKDTSAVAAILFEKGKLSFEYSQENGFAMLTEVKMRIKIYKKEGYDWVNQKVRYYLGNNTKEKVSFSEAMTYNLVAGKIEKTKLKSDGEFDEIINRYWGQKKITLPNVKEGSIIEFQYNIRSYSVVSPREWAFQSSIPVNYSEYNSYVPEYFVYNSTLKGFITPKITVDTSNKSIVLTSKERTQNGMVIKTTFSNDKIDYLETKTNYLVENIPAMKDEVYVNDIDNYKTSLVQELSMTKYPNSPLKTYSTDWNSVVKTIYQYDDFGAELNKIGYFEEDLKIVISGLNTVEEKVDAILKYVKATVKWNEYYGYSCNDGVKKAYKDKTGNVAEINLMLTAMLRYAGLTANPVLVSTRSNGIAMFPNRTAFNYVIGAVEDGANLILLDATDPFSTPNVLPFRALNWVGRLVRKDGTSREVDLMPKTTSNDIVTMNYSLNEKGEVLGKLRRQRTDHNAMVFRESIKDSKEDVYLEKLENENDQMEIQEYSRTNEKELKLPIAETLSFSGANFSELIGGKIYIKPMLSFAQKQNYFKQENREYPVDFGFPYLDKYAINIQIPAGFKVETLPSAMNISMQDNLANFKFMTSLVGNTIQISIVNQMNTPIVSAEYYSTLKEYFQKVIEKQNEKIVLIKI
ncbi:hypothetical protein IWX84_002992 [Flavobacterium sp. CG_9.10]|uniref:DUF3857 domain-containing protein n=1 Tax=Flavobacterium sp. CG_9.10 TaxID=2787729 RepID=UPI0018CB87E5|nr:DUF3857 domain-containing protein [Flavobacterium sp. CG_9.10]MBG6112096.1 hypothetical protein [Flavobacterium sp. CG_9.10]